MTAYGDQRIYSPSSLNREARLHLEAGFGLVWIEGEISNLSRPRSGHYYFSLKDDKALVRCALFRQRALRLQSPPTDGAQVRLRARVSVYEPRGDFQLIVEHLEDAGEGRLRRAFEALKQKLEAEGLFAAERKQPLPAYPRRIGVITSASGAAIRDIVNVIGRRWPAATIRLYAVPVQGEAAAPALQQALAAANRQGWADVLIMGRGGGSLEDLWAFNEEAVARAVADSKLPTVVAVGHETDFTIAEFAADLRAPTPSAAAESVTPDRQALSGAIRRLHERLARQSRQSQQQLQQRLDHATRRLWTSHPVRRQQQLQQAVQGLRSRLHTAMLHRLQQGRLRWQAGHHRLQARHPARHLGQQRQQIKALQHRLQAAQRQCLNQQRQRLAASARTLHAVSPLAVIARGYAVLRDQEQVITRVSQIQPGAQLQAQLLDGGFDCEVRSVHQQEAASALAPDTGGPPPEVQDH